MVGTELPCIFKAKDKGGKLYLLFPVDFVLFVFAT